MESTRNCWPRSATDWGSHMGPLPPCEYMKGWDRVDVGRGRGTRPLCWLKLSLGSLRRSSAGTIG
jgi:hypothetical protein